VLDKNGCRIRPERSPKIVATGSFTRAAERLNVAQMAVSARTASSSNNCLCETKPERLEAHSEEQFDKGPIGPTEMRLSRIFWLGQ
jgi:hypothetical protein